MQARPLNSSLGSTASSPPGAIERLKRLRSIAWLMDNSIPLPGGMRIGADAIIGLIPGIGDAVGALISAYLVNEARAMGAPRSVLLRMMGNVFIETVIGAIPFAGDLFDAAFKANMRNLALLEHYAANPVASRRTSRWFVFGFSVLMLLLVITIIAIPVLVIMAIAQLF
jgi:disulfide bond formation protein DsbB